ncbi:MAG: hypothetical protein M1837_006226 [Sclerophora amabilis]|nr:MAG: hypothetical protein M1837_006226 [Sclerophora amabilis]
MQRASSVKELASSTGVFSSTPKRTYSDQCQSRGLGHSLEGQDKKLFLEFMSKMLQWLPEDRKNARELLEDDWLLRDSPSKE